MTDLWIKFESHLLNEGISSIRRKKLKTMYNVALRGLDLSTATRENIEKFISELNRNEFKKIDGTSYSGNAKKDIKKFLKQFFKWYKGDNEYYPKEVSWIKTKIAKDEEPEERPIIELTEIPKLAKLFKKYDYQILTLLLFDSGFRIQEMMSVKKKDLTWEEFDDGKKCFWIKCNKSKTFPRKIPVPLFTEDISSFFNSAEYNAKGADDLLLEIKYDGYRKMLKKYGNSLIGRPLTPHCLRHSSATYYAREYAGNVPLLAQRYGWSFDARELKVYVRKSGAYNKQGAKISYRNDVTKLKEELRKIKEQSESEQKELAKQKQLNQITEERLKTQERQLKQVSEQFNKINTFMNLLTKNDPEVVKFLSDKAKEHGVSLD